MIPYIQRGDAAPAGRPAGSCKVAGVPEYCCVPKTQAGNATKCGFIAMLVRHSAHLMLDVLPVQYRNVANLQLCSSRTEMLWTQTVYRWTLTCARTLVAVKGRGRGISTN